MTTHLRRLAPGACVLLLAASLGACGAEESEEPTKAAGWKVLDYQGTRVSVPVDWERLDQGDCEVKAKRWGPAGTDNCGNGEGLAFYAAATFDPVHGPGLRPGEIPTAPKWGGYAYSGEYAVYAASDDRAVLSRILQSAKEK